MRIQYWTLETRKDMQTLRPADFQKIDEEIVALVGRCKSAERLNRIRELAEIYRVYASRTALMARELHDERAYQ